VFEDNKSIVEYSDQDGLLLVEGLLVAAWLFGGASMNARRETLKVARILTAPTNTLRFTSSRA